MSHINLKEYVSDILSTGGFSSAVVELDIEGRRGAVIIEDLEVEQRELQEVVEALNHVVARYAERTKVQPVFFDINGYRAAREKLIESLAVAAAQKVLASGKSIELPSMNSYERMLIHGQIGKIEGVISESTGLGRERRVIVSPGTKD